jgi:flagellar basal-body rod protein FlgG
MNPAMWISKSGAQAQDAKLQAIANNLANVNTVGFKRDRVVFADLAYQVEQQPGAQRADAASTRPACSSATARASWGRRRTSTTAASRRPTSRWTSP